MNIEQYIKSAHQLGEFLLSDSEELNEIIYKTSIYNSWFAEYSTQHAIKNIATKFLNKNNLQQWINYYQIDFSSLKSKKVGIVAAGNLPLVSFHDILSVILSGHELQIKLSEKDKILLPFIFKKWSGFLPELNDKIKVVERLEDFDAVIATGSNNSARYFEYYFKKYKHIIRKNRNSVAVLDGTETTDDLINLGHDILDYFGLGCRNVSKIFVPKGYDFNPLIQALNQLNYVEQHTPYMNNLDYQRTIYLMNQTPMLNIDFINIVENYDYASPIACLYYEYYDDISTVFDRIENDKDLLQCIVTKKHIDFGQTQQPTLFDYADNIDTMKFLEGI